MMNKTLITTLVIVTACGGTLALGKPKHMMKQMRNPCPLMWDQDQNGEISFQEIDTAIQELKKLDTNNDNILSKEELNIIRKPRNCRNDDKPWRKRHHHRHRGWKH